MSEIPLWGTGIGPGAVLLRRRITSEGNLRVTSEGDVRVAGVTNPDTVPQLFKTDNVTTDGGEQFGFRYETNPFQPPGEDGAVQGGEQVFQYAYLSFEWSMAAQIRVTPFADGNQDDFTLEAGEVLEIIPSTFSLEQQSGVLERVRRVFPVPIVQRIVRDGVEVNRFNLRGERVQFLIESTGDLGVGELMLDGIELESESLRKAIYPTVNSGT